MSVVRRSDGFRRYAFAVQYNGTHHLGFAHLGKYGENCITRDGTDLRGLFSVEGRIRNALRSLVGGEEENYEDDACAYIDKCHSGGFKEAGNNRDDGRELGRNYENFQVSSRTDRGVHALWNTFHVDIRPRNWIGNKASSLCWDPMRLVGGLNYHLVRQARLEVELFHNQYVNSSSNNDFTVNSSGMNSSKSSSKRQRRRGYGNRRTFRPKLFQSVQKQRDDNKATKHLRENNFVAAPPRSAESDIRILSCAPAPLSIPNKFYNSPLDDGRNEYEPPEIDWNARFTATSRTYIYRILYNAVGEQILSGDHLQDLIVSSENSGGGGGRILPPDFGTPFEADRSWRLVGKNSLNVEEMRRAASHLIGTHDFTSFRGRLCARSSPIVTLQDLKIMSVPFPSPWDWALNDYDTGDMALNKMDHSETYSNAHLVTIVIKGDAFLYRQVRNMVGCLVNVGRGMLTADNVKDILHARNRSDAPAMAPPHGLYLAHVEHGDFVF